jgi:MFS family permease
MLAFRSSFPSLRAIDTNAKYLILAGALVNFGGGYFTVARPVYMYAAGLNPTIIGLLIALQGLLGVVLSIPVAMLSDSFGRKRFVVLGLLFDAAGSFLFFYSLNLTVLVVAQVMFAFVTAAANAPLLALFTESTTKENRNEMFVLFYFVGGIATAMGSFAAGLPVPFESLFSVDYLGGFRLLFLVVSATSLASGLVVSRFISESRAEKMGRGGRLRFGDMFRLPKRSMAVVKKFSVIGFTGFGAGLVLPLLPLWYSLKFGVDASLIGPLFGSIFLTTAVASLFTPTLARRAGSVSTIIATQLLGTVLLVAMPLSPDYLAAGVVMVARSTLANMANPIMESFMMGLVHPEERATASSVIQMFDSVPRWYGPSVGGYLFSMGLIDVPFYFTAVLYAVSIGLFYLFFRRAESAQLPVETAQLAEVGVRS